MKINWEYTVKGVIVTNFILFMLEKERTLRRERRWERQAKMPIPETFPFWEETVHLVILFWKHFLMFFLNPNKKMTREENDSNSISHD